MEDISPLQQLRDRLITEATPTQAMLLIYEELLKDTNEQSEQEILAAMTGYLFAKTPDLKALRDVDATLINEGAKILTNFATQVNTLVPPQHDYPEGSLGDIHKALASTLNIITSKPQETNELRGLLNTVTRKINALEDIKGVFDTYCFARHEKSLQDLSTEYILHPPEN